jgi:hypothetical protein
MYVEQQNPEFKVPESMKKMTPGEAELLFPSDPEAVTYTGLQKVFVESSRREVPDLLLKSVIKEHLGPDNYHLK